MATYPCKMQEIVCVPRTIAGRELFYVDAIRNTDEWTVIDRVDGLVAKGFQCWEFLTRDNMASYLFYDSFMGWRVIITDVVVLKW